MYVFDFDGVLFDTKVAVMAAYKEAAGVPMPPHVWGLPWYEWTSAEVHNRKTELYPKYFGLVTPLPMLRLAMATPGSMILTGASQSAVLGILKAKSFTPSVTPTIELEILATQADRDEKVRALQNTPLDTVYFEDDREAAQDIAYKAHRNVVCVEQFLEVPA